MQQRIRASTVLSWQTALQAPHGYLNRLWGVLPLAQPPPHFHLHVGGRRREHDSSSLCSFSITVDHSQSTLLRAHIFTETKTSEQSLVRGSCHTPGHSWGEGAAFYRGSTSRINSASWGLAREPPPIPCSSSKLSV